MRVCERSESGAELLSRCYVAPLSLGVPVVDLHASLRPGNVLECCGASSCAKTALLVEAAVTCLLPSERSNDGVDYRGNCAGVLYLDLDGRLDAARLPLALSRRILRARQQAAPDGALCAPDDPVYRASLSRFRLLRCRSSAEVVQACAALDELVSPESASPAARLLLLDNLGAHYWVEKAARQAPADAGMSAFADSRPMRPPALDARTVHSALAAAVGAVARKRRLVVIATKHSFGLPTPPAAGTGGGPSFREYMSKEWQAEVSHRLHLFHPDAQSARVSAHWMAPLLASAGDLCID
jgi:DNA-repair protein XRCC2